MPTLPTISTRRLAAAAAAVAIGVPALAATTATAEPIYLPPLTPTEGTTWTEGPCAPLDGVTVVVDTQAEGTDAAEVRCATNEDGSAYDNDSSTQAFADAGFSVVTKDDGMVCLIDDTPDPNPCDEWTGVWWSFWQADAGADWESATTGSGTTKATTDSLIGFSLVTAEGDAPAPRAETTLAEGGTTEPSPEATQTEDATPTEDPAATATDDPTDAATDDTADAADDDSGSSTGLIIGLIVLAALLAGAAWMRWKRRTTTE